MNSGTVLCEAETVGATRVAKWKDNKACAFLLMFDDGLKSQVEHALPELRRRGLTATFYPNPGTGHYGQYRIIWETELLREGFELGNHTFTHRGGTTRAAVVEEITSSNEVIRRGTPDLPWPRLISYAKPGGLKKEQWPLTRDESDQVMADHHLIRRPGFSGRGARIAFTNGKQMLAHLDRAIKAEAMECVIFHGVGGDWISFPRQEFIRFLDGLKAREDKVWITGHMAAHKYEKERDTASVQVIRTAPDQITMRLTSRMDPAWYDQRLTLITTVPESWKHVGIGQGHQVADVTAHRGVVVYEALPGPEPITLTAR